MFFFAINQIKDILWLKNKKTGLIGHSEDGLATIGAIDKGVNVDFMIQRATPGEKHGTLL